MINCKELRIGNLLLFSNNSSVFKVTGISEYGIYVEDKVEETYMEYDNFEPIPITEEWLLKFGFSQRLSKDWFFNDEILIEKSFKGDVFSIRFRVFKSESIQISKLKHIHQLQNLYYALTQKELTI